MRGVFVLDIEKEMSERKPDNTLTMDINGTHMIMDIFFNGTETINDIVAKRIKREFNPDIPNGENG